MKRFKTLFLIFIFTCFSTSLFAIEEKISQIYQEIDIIFVERSEDDLNDILKENVEHTHYYLVENYSKKKVRRLVIENDYEFAMTAIYIIIDNNIDGGYEDEDAIDMYSAIAEAWEDHQQYEIEMEEERQKQLAKKEAENEKIRKNLDRKYVVSGENKEGQVVYLSEKETKTSNHKWIGSLGMINAGCISLMDNPFNVNIGISLAGMYEYEMQNLTFGVDLFGELTYLQLNTQLPLITTLDFNTKFAMNKLSNKLFFKIGITSLHTVETENQKYLTNDIISPTIGIELENLNIGKTEFTIGANYYLAGLFREDINQAFGFHTNLAIPFAEMEEVKMNFNIGVRDKLILTAEKGIENRMSLVIGFGVENVNR